MCSCTVPGPVSGLSATPGVVQLTISWSPPSEPNGVIIAYEVCSNSSGVFSYTNTSDTQLILRDLPPNTVVTFSVRAYTIIGPGENVTGQASTGSARELVFASYNALKNILCINMQPSASTITTSTPLSTIEMQPPNSLGEHMVRSYRNCNHSFYQQYQQLVEPLLHCLLS